MPKNILVVEDNEINRDLTREILECHGYEVSEAEDGEQGVRLVKKTGGGRGTVKSIVGLSFIKSQAVIAKGII